MPRAPALLRYLAGVSIVVALALLVMGWHVAHRDPIVRRVTLTLPNWPRGAPPIRVALASDIHAGGGAMPADRPMRMIDQIAATNPALVILAGDFVDRHEARTARAAAPSLAAALRRLHPPLGTIAVLGNHDDDSDPAAVAHALRAGGATVLENEAVVRGPLVIGGVGDAYSGHDQMPRTLLAMQDRPGARLFVTHSPDIATKLPPTATLLAGHTHCGQIVLPLIGALWVPSRYGNRYRCGIVREGGHTVVVTAGLGTSMVPLRIGAPPDIWLVTLGPRGN